MLVSFPETIICEACYLGYLIINSHNNDVHITSNIPYVWAHYTESLAGHIIWGFGCL